MKYLDPDFYVEAIARKVHGDLGKEKPFKWQAFDAALMVSVYIAFAYLLYSALGYALNTPEPLVVVVSGSMEPVLYRGDVVIMQGVDGGKLKASEISLTENIQGVPLKDLAELAFKEADPECVSKRVNTVQEICLRTRNPGCAPNVEAIKKSCEEVTSIKFKSGEVIEIATEGDVVVYDAPQAQKEIIHRVVAKLKAPEGYYLLTKGDNKETNYNLDQDCGSVSNGVPEKPCISLYPVPMSQVKGKSLFKIPLLGYVKLIVFQR